MCSKLSCDGHVYFHCGTQYNVHWFFTQWSCLLIWPISYYSPTVLASAFHKAGKSITKSITKSPKLISPRNTLVLVLRADWTSPQGKPWSYASLKLCPHSDPATGVEYKTTSVTRNVLKACLSWMKNTRKQILSPLTWVVFCHCNQ